MARLLHAKAGPLPSGVGGREPSANRRSKQSRTVGEVATTSAGAACTTEVNSVAGPVAITLRLTPRPMGQPRSGRKRCLMLELYASKGARTVLRGGGAGNSTSLPDIKGESSTVMGRPRRSCRPTCRWRTTSPHRESGLTSLGSSVTREPRPTDSGRQADMSAAEMLAGAAPGRSPNWYSLEGKKVWRAFRRHPARIVKAVAKAAASREGRL
jgi:hypothetical protein